MPMDFNDVIKRHIESKNDVTVVYKAIDDADKNFIDCETLNINEVNRVISIGENIGREKEVNINMEMYIMKTDLFVNIVYECIKNGVHRKVRDYISRNLNDLKVGAFEFKGYLACVNSIKSYFDTNMDLLNQDVNKELFYDNNPIYTKSQDETPTQYTEASNVVNSIVANGSYIEGTVKNCVIGRRVHVGKGTVLENCIIMQNSIIEENVEMTKVIADKGTKISKNQNINGAENYPVTIQKKKVI